MTQGSLGDGGVLRCRRCRGEPELVGGRSIEQNRRFLLTTKALSTKEKLIHDKTLSHDTRHGTGAQIKRI